MSIQLRPYQQKIFNETKEAFISGKKAPLIVSACGSGKTVIFCSFTRSAIEKGRQVLILCHREELIDQISSTLDLFNVQHTFVASNRLFSYKSKVHVASVFTAVKRLKNMPKPDLIIIDEAHRCIKKSTFGKVLDYFPESFKIGVTASPVRLSGEPLGDIFDDIILGPTVRELIQIGALSDYRLYAPPGIDLTGIKKRMGDYAKKELEKASDKPSITGNAIEEYRKLANGKRAIAFCVSIEHAKHVAEEFTKSGYMASCIDGTMDRGIRKHIVNRFRTGKLQVLTSVDLVSEGFDLPAIEVGILLRPTMSLGLFIQQTGRPLRTMEGKEFAIILDHAGNCKKHGFPCQERQWSLEGKNNGEPKGEKSMAIRICPKCFAAIKGFMKVCSYCEHTFDVKSREVQYKKGELVEVNKDIIAAKADWRNEQWRAKSREELVALGKERGYKNPHYWAKIIMDEREKRRKNVQTANMEAL